MENINLQPDCYSVLTNISANESPKSTPRSICLHTDERFIGFQRNDDPNVAKYMETKVEKFGWEKYKYQCWQYGIPPIRAIQECLSGESDLNLAVSIQSILFNEIYYDSLIQYYIPKSIGAAYAFEILLEQPEIKLTRIDMKDCPMTKTVCIPLNDLLRRTSPIEYLNLKNNKYIDDDIGVTICDLKCTDDFLSI